MKSWEDFNISQLTLEFLCSFNFLSKKYFGAISWDLWFKLKNKWCEIVLLDTL